eukprot:15381203-Heterocapsa_arctica.AAC.1
MAYAVAQPTPGCNVQLVLACVAPSRVVALNSSSTCRCAAKSVVPLLARARGTSSTRDYHQRNSTRRA